MRAAIVIPTWNEAANAPELLTRLHAAMQSCSNTGEASALEVLFVDDGDDDLPLIAAAHAERLGLPVRVLRRTNPLGGLSGAVVAGIQGTAAPIIVVCDGDLQHPPELIPAMLEAIRGADLVVASRYVPGGDASGLASRWRHLVSRISIRIARAVFPRRLRACTDPMSGFFAVRREAIDLDRLRPQGFKILLEIVGCAPVMAIAEIPLTFEARRHGESRAGFTQGLRYLQQLVGLRFGRPAPRTRDLGPRHPTHAPEGG